MVILWGIQLFFNLVDIVYLMNGFAITVATNWRSIRVEYGKCVPRELKVFKFGSVKIYCGSYTPVFAWSFQRINGSDSNEIINNDRHHVGLYSLTLNNLTLEDSGTYSCYGRLRSRRLFTAETYVKVVGNISYGDVIPNRIELSRGAAVTLTCGSIKDVLWISNVVSIETKNKQGNRLLLKNLRRKHSGRYMCRGVDAYHNIFHSTGIVIVDGFLVRHHFRNFHSSSEDSNALSENVGDYRGDPPRPTSVSNRESRLSLFERTFRPPPQRSIRTPSLVFPSRENAHEHLDSPLSPQTPLNTDTSASRQNSESTTPIEDIIGIMTPGSASIPSSPDTARP